MAKTRRLQKNGSVSRQRPRAAAPRANKPKRSTPDRVRQLIHELQVYSEEITVQNEHLLKTQEQLEEARDRFADLYDFAPIGYLSLKPSGTITEINLAAAALFDRTRTFLVNMPLPALVERGDRDRLRTFLLQVLAAHGHGAPPHIEIALRSDALRIVRLVARTRGGMGRVDVLMAMIDVTQERRMERERETAMAQERARAAELSREVAERLGAEERVKALLDRLVDVQEEERRGLSRNLHDHLGQQLTALRLAIGTIKERGRASGDSHSGIGVIEGIVSDLDRDLDRLAWDLRPPVLDDNGLSAALQTLVREWGAMTGVDAQFHANAATAHDHRVGRDVESHVYRIAQEALTNVAKHAGAKRVSVLLKQTRDELALIVEDDGCGFSKERGQSAADSGLGLVNMRERAALIGGELQIESVEGKGATVFVKIPLRATRRP